MCFRCGDKFHPLHQCYEKQLRLLVLDESENINPEGEIVALEAVWLEEEEELQCKLMELLGSRGDRSTECKSMELEGKILGINVVVVVGSGTICNLQSGTICNSQT